MNTNKKGNFYQLALIFLGIISCLFFSVFVYREIFPEYRVYQNDYVALEAFRSTYTHKSPPAFTEGVKQIVLEVPENGPPVIDRCTSCHVALDIPYFSPTKLMTDEQGTILRDAEGVPRQEPNKDYIWKKLEEEIAKLPEGSEKERLKNLKITVADGITYDVTKALQMHPLIGKETRPFEFHPINEYGCTICHSGNGRALTVDKAHGPVFDGKYEIEDEGHERKFLEKDQKNDPSFAKVFNDKPGHKLIFQTTPLFVGGLIEAKCVQCHTPEKEDKSVRKLTSTYLQGKELFIEQGCYACHRINGFSRGGIGPELTTIGTNYPWYIKRHIVWPQQDLPTSTMPNYKLDHEELEALMTFLLAQKGNKDAISKVDYKRQVASWEKGQKMAFEEPVSKQKMFDLKAAMIVFASEGCAACHRLKGFESNVGFAIEKDTQASFDKLQNEKNWFRKLFKEDLLGSQIVKAIDDNAKEIDQHIASDVRKDAILEEIEEKFPDLIESFYSNFKFAKRANQTEDYQKRLHNVLMIYVQEYGLGRMIGPRPNWSGIYRSDEWLMEHFKKPTAHVARSIMPVFPFDDTKFYALTHMLDELSIKNNEETRKLWQIQGFNPALAYQTHCAQCHGEHLGGNGLVAEWIYPIPKNLKNAEFLRNYTKEELIKSIHHGVAGTPMAPWGEVARDKNNTTPVLTESEIKQLVDWLFATLPGNYIEGSKDIPKWNYSPENVIQEIKDEGFNSDRLKDLSKVYLFKGEGFIADNSTKPVYQKSDVEEFFDVKKGVKGEKEYYIKKEFYTPSNLKKAEDFYQLNCASCHGADADGMGLRSEVMQESKPRMFTNLEWLDTHDDLYLLRSIKFGVPGTSMTPWGDLTTSTLRMQLVMYIRSLNKVATEQKQIDELLYKTFNSFDFKIDRLSLENTKDYTVFKNNLVSEKNIYRIINQQILSIKDNQKLMNLFVRLLEVKEFQYEIKDKQIVNTWKNEEYLKFKDLQNQILQVLKEKIEASKAALHVLKAKIASQNIYKEMNELETNIKTLEDFETLSKKSFNELDQLQKDNLSVLNGTSESRT